MSGVAVKQVRPRWFPRTCGADAPYFLRSRSERRAFRFGSTSEEERLAPQGISCAAVPLRTCGKIEVNGKLGFPSGANRSV